MLITMPAVAMPKMPANTQPTIETASAPSCFSFLRKRSSRLRQVGNGTFLFVSLLPRSASPTERSALPTAPSTSAPRPVPVCTTSCSASSRSGMPV